jgi:hypothetical protein
MTKSDWQTRIEGDWHGLPAVFDADGTQVGHIQVTRASTVEGGRTTYTMTTTLDVRGQLRARFEAAGFAFGVDDRGTDRIYLGPDFVGAGRPYGDVVDAHYYSPGWHADLRTLVHIVPRPDGQRLQVYSSLLHEGPTLLAVFNGLYCLGDPGTVKAHVARERAAAGRTHVLPLKHAGRWVGDLAVHDQDGAHLGTNSARIEHRPLTLLRAESTVTLEGAVTARWRAIRSRAGNRHTWDGPDLWGNAIGYGRALYPSLHVFGQPLTLSGREFLLDDGHDLSVVWTLDIGGRARRRPRLRAAHPRREPPRRHPAGHDHDHVVG